MISSGERSGRELIVRAEPNLQINVTKGLNSFSLVTDSLQYSPEQCTVVATYRRLVVGAAFLSSPQETYITFLVVRAGWEGAQIATYVSL